MKTFICCFILAASVSLAGISVSPSGGGGGGSGNVSNTGTPVANQIAIWNSATALKGTTGITTDGNGNLLANSFLPSYRSTATAAATTTLTVADARNQDFTGTMTQTVLLPVTSTLPTITGGQWDVYITNRSTGTVTVNSSGGNLVISLPANTAADVKCVSNSGTTASSWNPVSNANVVTTSMLGTGVLTALGVNTGTAGALVLFNGALGTPSSGIINNASVTMQVNTAGYAADQVLTAAQCYGSVIHVTAAGVMTLPAVAAGMSVTVVTVGATAVSVKPNGSEVLMLDGTALTGGHKATNTSTAGDLIVLTYYGSGEWYAASNAWTDGG